MTEKAIMDSAGLHGVTQRRHASFRNYVGSKRLNLALQGGGAHGAFTWGVLDRLLEDERIEIEGISATSAGAMNAAVLAYGHSVGGRPGARDALHSFWRRVAHTASMSPIQATLLDRMTGNRSLENSPAFMWLDLLTRLMSPYQFNPGNYNPLRHALEQSVDFSAMESDALAIKLYLTATNVRTGKIKIFCGKEVTLDAVMASGCVPFLFQAVEIANEHYWDGGYMGNPAIYPLIYDCDSRDILIVQINPVMRDHVPRTPGEIMNRVNEISFNSSLLREMRAIAFVTKLIDERSVPPSKMKRMLIHSLSLKEGESSLGVMSKFNADWDFLLELKHIGRTQADTWLRLNFDRLGHESTIDITRAYM